MNAIVKLSLSIIFLVSTFAAKGGIDLKLTPVNGTCVSDCAINASATGTTGTVAYSLINYPTMGQNTLPQASGKFTGLPPGTYTVGIYDETTAGKPVTKDITVTTNYVPLLGQSPVASYSSSVSYCDHTGTLAISILGGKSPFRYKITNTTTGISSEVKNITSRSYTFGSLASGDYEFEVEDACGQWIQNRSGKYTTVTSPEKLLNTTFSGIDFSYNNNSYMQFANNGNCKNFSFLIYYYYIKVYLNGTTSALSLSDYSQVQIRAEYPANSGTFSEWKNIYSQPALSFNNFDPNKNTFRLQVKHPCSGTITTSPEYTMLTPVFRSSISSNTSLSTDYCITPYNVNIDLYRSYSTGLPVYPVDGCGPYTVVLKNSSTDAIVSTLTTPSTGTGYTSVQFKNVPAGTYSAIITNSAGFSQTITGITIPNSTNIIPSFYTYNTSPFKGYNFIFCDYATTGISAYMYPYVSTVPVTYSITATGTTPAITRTPVVITHTNYSNQKLWDDIPWGEYNITADMGCKTETVKITFTQPVTGFKIESLTIDYPVCGLNRSKLIADAYYHKNENRISNTAYEYMYWMLIVDGPAKIGTRAYGYSYNSESYRATINDLPAGTYTVLFYPYDIPVATRTVNGKEVPNYPVTMHSCYEERTITIPEDVTDYGFTVNSLTVDYSVCGLNRNKLIADAYYHKNGTRMSTDSEYRYWMLIVDGPEKTGVRASAYSHQSYRAEIGNLSPGTYTVLFYPYNIAVSTQTIEGKEIQNYPVKMLSCYEKRTITIPESPYGFTIKSLTIDNTTVCGSNDLVADAYYHKNGTSVSSTAYEYRYYMLIVNGPAKIGERAYGYSYDNSNYQARIRNLPGGTYKVLFYPYYISVSTQIVNGKTVYYYPDTKYSCYEERTVVVEDYVRPIVDIPMSGGITCTSGVTNLGVSIGKGSKPPFLYRYKVKGEPDDKYTPADFQSSNVFSDLPTGDYTVQIKDDCGSITTQDIRIFNNNEQFVRDPGIVCEDREVVLSVMSIGPVESYKWEYQAEGNNSWTTLSSTTGTYVIPSASKNDIGEYRVTVNNGLCELTNIITISTVTSPPAAPSITASGNVICLGGNLTLTAQTDLVSPNYQWYKDGVPVGTNSSTYLVTAAGSYTVTVTPSLGCPSDPSEAYVVTEQIPAHPDASDLSSDVVCNGGNPVIHLASSQAGVTYMVYIYSSGGTSVGSAVGTGSAIDIPLTTKPSSNVIYYVGAKLNNCNSASRTAVTVTIVSVPATPVVNTIPAMCDGTEFSIDIPSPDANYFYKVYTASSGGSPIGQSTKGSGTISGLTAPASSTTYYVSAVLSTGCESNRKPVPITVKTRATSAHITASNANVCYGMSTTLTANSNDLNPVYRWYRNQTELTPIHVGASYTTSALIEDTVLYVSLEGTSYCENIPGTRKAITVTVRPYPQLSVSDVEISCGSTTSLHASSDDVSASIRWYSDKDFNNEIGSGKSFTTAALTTDTTFYVEAKSAYGCATRETVEVTVLPFAHDDYATTIATTPIKIDVLANDCIPNGCTPPVLVIAPLAKHGTATVVNDSVQYTAVAGFVGLDTVTYSISCDGKTSTAKVIVSIQEYPDNIIDAHCYITPPATEWGIKVDWRSPERNISEYIIPFVGDLDGDGTPEIVCFTTANRILITAGTVATAVNTIAIYDGQSKALKKIIELPSHVTDHDAAAYGLVRRPSDGKGLIVVATLDYKLRAYDITGTLIWTSDVDYGAKMGDFAVNVGFADFNIDGLPEVYVRDKIYNASTGKLLAQVSSPSNTGSSWAHWTYLSTKWKLSSPLAADVLGDSNPELILGNEIYSVTIANPDGSAGNSINLLRTATLPSGVSTSDGHAQVADFNMDGHLDILITNRSTNANIGVVAVYIWDVYNNTTSSALTLNTSWSGKNIPLIADVNNNNKLDIVLQCDISGTNDDMPVYEYDVSANTFTLLWAVDPDEDSYSNSATLFDFNMDGQNEVLITDQSKVRIFRGSDGATLNEFSFPETTIMQYPVIADVDMDGTADIVVCGGSTLNVLKSSGSPWASARKVWNQYMYNSVNINEDLTVPTTLFNPATVFVGEDGLSGTADDVRPYNNFLQQQTTLNTEGLPVWPISDATFTGTPIVTYYGDGDSLVIIADATNIGDASLNATFYFSAYKNAIDASNNMTTDSSMISLRVGDKLSTKLTIRNYSSYLPMAKIIAVINDKGAAAYVQQECKYDNNTFEYDPDDLPRAFNDTVSTLINTAIIIDVKLNDLIPSSCSSVVPEITTLPTKGVATIVNDRIEYTPATDFYGVDSLVYRLTCTTNKTETKVYIVVHKPISDTYIGCGGTNVAAGFEHIDNVKYLWYTVETGGSTDNVAMDTRLCPAPSEWWVEAQYKSVAIDPRHKVNIDVYSPITAGSIKDNDTICYNTVPKPFDNVTSASGGNGIITYKWQFSEDNGGQWTDIIDATSENYTVVNALTQTTWYRRTATNECGTVHTDSVHVIVYPLPNLTVDNDTIEICYGKTANPAALSADADVTITWYHKSDYTSEIDQASSFETTALMNDTIFYVEAVSAEGCISRDSVRVIIHPLPELTVDKDTIEICYGQIANPAALSADADDVITWYHKSDYTSEIKQASSFETTTLMTDTIFYVEAESVHGCISRDSVTVIVHPLPALTVEKDTIEICYGQTAIPAVSTDADVAITWYHKSDYTSEIDQASSFETTALMSDTIFYVEAVSAEGCISRDSVTVIVHSLPHLTVDNDTIEICYGQTAIPAVSTDADVAITWYHKSDYTSEIDHGRSFETTTLMSDTIFYVEAVSVHGCISRDSVRVTVHSLPHLTVDSDTIAICYGQTAIPTALSVDAVSVTWYSDANCTDKIVQANSFDTAALMINTIFYVESVSTEGCISRDSVTIIVHPLPHLAIDNDTIEICYGQIAIPSTSNVNYNVSITWYSDANYTNEIIQANSFETEALMTDTIFYVEAVSEYGCITRDTLAVKINPLPILTKEDQIICSGNSVVITVSSPDEVTFTWFDDNRYSTPIIHDAVLHTTAINVDTVFYIEAQSDKKCTTRDSVNITVIIPPSVEAMADRRLCYGKTLILSTLQSDGVISWNVDSEIIRPDSTQNYIVTASRPPCPDVTDTVTITVGDSLYIQPDTLSASYKRGVAYSQPLITNAATPVFRLLSNDLLSGLHLSSDGIISASDIPGQPHESIATFIVQVEDHFGCTVEQEYALTIEMFIPKAFTPNGDGVNDYFMRGHRVVIFDRLGIELFRGDDGWDGSHKGNPVAEDIYFYTLPDINRTGYIGVVR
jgi:gliding motility-associated-like protein